MKCRNKERKLKKYNFCPFSSENEKKFGNGFFEFLESIPIKKAK